MSQLWFAQRSFSGEWKAIRGKCGSWNLLVWTVPQYLGIVRSRWLSATAKQEHVQVAEYDWRHEQCVRTGNPCSAKRGSVGRWPLFMGRAAVRQPGALQQQADNVAQEGEGIWVMEVWLVRHYIENFELDGSMYICKPKHGGAEAYATVVQVDFLQLCRRSWGSSSHCKARFSQYWAPIPEIIDASCVLLVLCRKVEDESTVLCVLTMEDAGFGACPLSLPQTCLEITYCHSPCARDCNDGVLFPASQLRVSSNKVNYSWK